MYIIHGFSPLGGKCPKKRAKTRAVKITRAALIAVFSFTLVPFLGEVGVLAIFFLLNWVLSRKWFHGQVLLTYAIVYPILRSILELFRGDAGRGYVIDGVLSTSQFISILVAGASLITMFVLRQKQKTAAARLVT